MQSDIHKDTAIKYHVEDLAGALIPGSRLSNILRELENNRSISNYSHDFLFKNGLYALLRYAKNEINFAEFLRSAEPEQSARKRSAKEKVLKEQAEQNLQREALQARMKVTQERMAAECVFRPKTASVPAGKRPPFRWENGRCSDGNAATIPAKTASTK